MADDQVFDISQTQMTAVPGKDKLDNEYEDGIVVCSGTEIQGFCSIGRCTELNGATIYGYTKIGRYCSIGRGAAIGCQDHAMSGVSTSMRFPAIGNLFRPKSTILGHDVWVGANANILAGVVVGHGAVIGAGAVVTRDVAPYTIVVGMPAKAVRRRFTDAICDALVESRWWELPHDVLLTLPFDDPERTVAMVSGLSKDGSFATKLEATASQA